MISPHIQQYRDRASCSDRKLFVQAPDSFTRKELAIQFA